MCAESCYACACWNRRGQLLCDEDSFAHQSASKSPSGAWEPWYLASAQLTDRRRDATCSSSSSCIARSTRSIVRAQRGRTEFQCDPTVPYRFQNGVPFVCSAGAEDCNGNRHCRIQVSWAAGIGQTATTRRVACFNVFPACLCEPRDARSCMIVGGGPTSTGPGLASPYHHSDESLRRGNIRKAESDFVPRAVDRLYMRRKPNHNWRPYRRDRSSQSSIGTVGRLAATIWRR